MRKKWRIFSNQPIKAQEFKSWIESGNISCFLAAGDWTETSPDLILQSVNDFLRWCSDSFFKPPWALLTPEDNVNIINMAAGWCHVWGGPMGGPTAGYRGSWCSSNSQETRSHRRNSFILLFLQFLLIACIWSPNILLTFNFKKQHGRIKQTLHCLTSLPY